MSAALSAAMSAVVVLAASSCAGDDDPDAGPSVTTVPVPTTDGAGTTSSTPVDPDAPPDGDLTRAQIRLEEVAVLDSPIDTTVVPDGTLWVAQRGGAIVALDHLTGEVGATIVDLSAETTTDNERGLLGIADDGEYLYVNFTDQDGNTNIDAFALDGAGVGARHHLLSIEQPYGNHNGGAMAIGPDGHLYIGVGDGGSSGDPRGAGQDPDQLLGSILRIDPTPGGPSPYGIPPDNPFADGTAGRPEIFATGARNPWRFSFDEQTGDLWIADVGQSGWEEIDLLLAANGAGLGANLGWNLREGTREYAGDRPEGSVDPVFEYPHGDGTPGGCSISGGRVYRGSAIPELVGSYLFGDWCADGVWAISVNTGEVVFRDFGITFFSLVGFGVDPDGELLVLSLGGPISRIVPA